MLLTGGSIIVDYGLIFCSGLKFKRFNDGFVFYKHAAFHFTRNELMNWSRVDYCDVFISCLDSHSDGTHSL